jgi:uncharacterized protein (UPF0548 family)
MGAWGPVGVGEGSAEGCCSTGRWRSRAERRSISRSSRASSECGCPVSRLWAANSSRALRRATAFCAGESRWLALVSLLMHWQWKHPACQRAKVSQGRQVNREVQGVVKTVVKGMVRCRAVQMPRAQGRHLPGTCLQPAFLCRLLAGQDAPDRKREPRCLAAFSGGANRRKSGGSVGGVG